MSIKDWWAGACFHTAEADSSILLKSHIIWMPFDSNEEDKRLFGCHFLPTNLCLVLPNLVNTDC